MRPRDLSGRADALRTLLIFTALQAFLLTIDLHLLPMWGGEASTLRGAALPVREILRSGKPPLYFLLAHAWLKLTGSADALFALRLLSALYAIAATILLDRLWLRKAPAETRQWVLQLWALSPCLLLFGRMAQPYSLQALLTVVAVWSLLRFAEECTSWTRMAALAASLAALLYAHYLPGIAVWSGANVFLWMRLRGEGRPWARPTVLAAVAYVPWVVTQVQLQAGNGWSQAALSLACGFYSLAFGEAIPMWLLILSAVLAIPYLMVLCCGARTHRQWLLPAATVVLLGFIGAAHWVSYPFVGAHLLFLLPLCLVAVAAGIGQLGRLGTAFGIALFAANTGGVWSYFETHDILNSAYVAPFRQIAALVAVRSSPSDSLVLVDGLNVDDSMFTDYLPLNFAVRVLRSPVDADAAWAGLQKTSGIRHVWFLRNSHDISPGQALEGLEQRMMGAWYSHAMHPYVSAPAVSRAVMKYVLHQTRAPEYVYELWEFRR